MTDAMTMAWATAATLSWCLVGGLALGTVFYGGLWWTVRKAVTHPRPALLFLVSFVLRTAVSLVGFFVVADGRWDRMVVCLGGFIAARFIVTRLTRPPEASPRTVALKEGPLASQP